MYSKPLIVILYLSLEFFSVLCIKKEGLACLLRDGTEGACIRLSNCLEARKELKELKFPKFCSYNVLQPIVCCYDCTAINNSPHTYNFMVPGYTKANDRCLEEYYKKIPCNQVDHIYQSLDDSVMCYDKPYDSGMSVSPVVAGGYDARRTEFPHMALIGYGDDSDSADWMCGGSVISDRFILTAAHCISSPSLGEIKFAALGILKRTDIRSMWQIYDVTKIIAYPDYKPPSKYHDIALLATGARIRYNREVVPACLHRGSDLPAVATATGWGALGHRKPLAEVLQVVKVKRYSDDACFHAYPKHRHLVNGYNMTTQVCYGDEDLINDTCEGDSGGPLQIESKGEQKNKCLYTVVGVTSYGRSCGFVGSSGMYTRVAYYMRWIEAITGRLI